MTHVPHPIEEFDLRELRLDLSNYRVTAQGLDEHGVMRILIAAEGVLDVASKILREGYFDNEVPIVVVEEGGPVVLEGNRRVTALKILNDPTLVPEHQAHVESLIRRYREEADDLPVRIRALVVPSREVARAHVARLHTGGSKKRWSLDQQASFYYDLLGEFSAEELVEMFPGARIVRLLKMGAVRRFLQSVAYEDSRAADLVGAGGGLTMSAFEYAYRLSDIAQAIGLEFADDGRLSPVESTPEELGRQHTGVQRRALERLLLRFADDEHAYDTRTLAFKKRDGVQARRQLIEDLLAEPPSQSAGSPSADTSDERDGSTPSARPVREAGAGSAGLSASVDISGRAGDRGGARGVRGPNSTDTLRYLDLRGIPYGGDVVPSNLRDRYIELRQLDLTRTPIAAAVMLRVVLEATAKFHFEGSPHRLANAKFLDCVSRLADVYGKDKSLANAINTLRSGSAQKPGSAAWLNVVSHSAHIAVSDGDVRTAIKTHQLLLIRLLTPYQASS